MATVRLDFRVSRLERWLFGTSVPGGAGGGDGILSKRIAISGHTESATAGPPSDEIGENGATHFDTAPAASGGQFGYIKLGGSWRQLA